MKINLAKMFKIQNELNQKILETQHKTFDEIKTRSHLALMCELMELANETRCFNYWSKKTRGEDSDVLEEFADVLCFIFSECIMYKVQDSDELELKDDELETKDNIELTDGFLELINLYTQIKDKQTCLNFVKKLFVLGYGLGYNFEQIQTAYENKCLKNHKVQESFKE